MSIPAKHWALAQDVKGSSANRIVLNQLADWMIGETAVECWPSLETLVFETGLNRQTVMKATAALEAMGLIVKKKVHKNFRWHTRYSFVGFDPNEWKNTSRPDHCGPASDFPIEEDIEGTNSRTSEGVDFHTSEGTKSHTVEGTENQLFGRPKNQLFVRPVFRTRTRNRQEIRQEEQVESSHARESEPPPPTDSDLEAMASSGSLFAEADVPAEEPPKKKPRPPTVPFPDSLPDEWRERALKLRPNIDPEEVFTALRSRYGETTVRKAMSTWQREYFNWHGRQWPKKTFNRNQTQGRAYVPGDRKFSYATLDTSQFDYEG